MYNLYKIDYDMDLDDTYQGSHYDFGLGGINLNTTFDANEYDVGTFGDGKLSGDFYKYRPIVTRIVFIEMMAEDMDEGHIVPPAFADLSESDKKDNIIKFKECVECARSI